VDVTDKQSVHSLVELAQKEFGRIDYLVNAAGVSAQKPENGYYYSDWSHRLM
jgi:NADP-dependent 3-hydroxy acid dehydrogenase YdfG